MRRVTHRRPVVETVLSAAGIVGPLVFIADWATLGATASQYSPINDAISRLAETAAPTRAAMTTGFLVYGGSLVAYGVSSRSWLPASARALIAGTGLATFGLTAFSLDAAGQGTIHGVFAALGYATLAAAPLLTARALSPNPEERLWARASAGAGVLSATFLIASAVAPVHGLWQRVGLTVGDAWVIAAALRSLRAARDA